MAITKKVTNGTLVPDDFFEKLPFWNELSQAEQKTVQTGTEGAYRGLRTMRQSRLEVVVSLQSVRAVLLEKGHWVKYLHSLSPDFRSSYRWLNRAAELALPQPVLEGAIAQGMDLIHGSYAAAIVENPPPKRLAEADPTDKSVGAYLNKIERGREDKWKEDRSGGRRNPDLAEKKAWRAVIHQWNALKGTRAQQRASWAIRLIGRLMAEMGIPAQKIEPEAVPEEFRPKPGYPAGRPRK